MENLGQKLKGGLETFLKFSAGGLLAFLLGLLVSILIAAF